jgi:hypothetical protein
VSVRMRTSQARTHLLGVGGAVRQERGHMVHNLIASKVGVDRLSPRLVGCETHPPLSHTPSAQCAGAPLAHAIAGALCTRGYGAITLNGQPV